MILLNPIIPNKILELRGLFGWSSENFTKCNLEIKKNKIKDKD